MSNYWIDREVDTLNKLTDKSIDDTEKQLIKYYKSALKDVIASMSDTYTHLLDTMVKGKNPTPADLYKLDKYWTLQADIAKILENLGNQEMKQLSKDFVKQYQGVYDNVAIKDKSSTFKKLDTKNVEQMIKQVWCADGKSWSERVWGNCGKLADRLNESLISCVATGKKPSELKRMLMEDFGVSYSSAKRLVDTEMAHIQTQAAHDRYVDYGVDEVEVIVEADACPECRKLIGKKFPIHGKMPVPLHPNCRCCIVPVIKKPNLK